jgi:hypothetical protein
MGGIAKIQTELSKGKPCVEVEEKIEKILTDGDVMLVRFSKVMEPVKKKWKQHGHLIQKPKDSVNDTPKNTTNVTPKSKEEIVSLDTMI